MTDRLLRAIADKGTRTARREASRRLSQAWQGRPEWQAARAALDDSFDALEAVRPMLERLDWLFEGFASLARAACADPLFEPPLAAIRDGRRSGLRLFAHPRVAITAIHMPPATQDGGSVGLDGRAGLLRFVTGSGTIGRFRAAPDRQACRLVATTRIDTTAVTAFAADEAWVLVPGASACVVLQATLSATAEPLRRYDRATGALLATSAGDGTAMRLQLMASLLRRLGRRDGAAALAEAARSGPYHQRWHLARELTALDRTAARPLLHDLAAADPHPEVRAAARATLNLLAA